MALCSAVVQELENLAAQVGVKPVQHATWATPQLLIRKKNGTIRQCGDYRRTVNATVKIFCYPLSAISEVLASFRGATVFSILNLFSAYQFVKVTGDTAAVLTINTVKGLYHVKRFQLGISAAPAIFLHLMETTLGGIPGVSVYLNDVIVSGADAMEHIERLNQVLSKLDDTGLRLVQEKCQFAMKTVQFLGRMHVSGVYATEEKVEAILKVPKPSGKPELQAFLRLLAYICFWKNGATVATDLFRLLEKDVPWTWENRHRRAFKSLKKLIKDLKVLTHYDESKRLLLSGDASPYGVGAVLVQEDEKGGEVPVAFASRTLGASGKNYSQLDKKGLAIIFAEYHRSPTTARDPWVYKANYTYDTLGCQTCSKTINDLVYRQGKRHQNADALSRLPLLGKVHARKSARQLHICRLNKSQS